jgi:hypothetical protein
VELVGDPLREKYQTLPHIGSQFGIFFELFFGQIRAGLIQLSVILPQLVAGRLSRGRVSYLLDRLS